VSAGDAARSRSCGPGDGGRGSAPDNPPPRASATDVELNYTAAIEFDPPDFLIFTPAATSETWVRGACWWSTRS
jgi:hypothetical protein